MNSKNPIFFGGHNFAVFFLMFTPKDKELIEGTPSAPIVRNITGARFFAVLQKRVEIRMGKIKKNIFRKNVIE